mmetsp:Transcript_54193/g.110570  ORF Transcript_54193/g.110570 Transcript_54193/m.110570 type:complete len:286 (-) Transcript_54193:264-1121(-)
MTALAALPRVNVDGIEGSSIPGGLHAAKYGGGDDYRAMEPIVSSSVHGACVKSHPLWSCLVASLGAATPCTLQLLHGYSDEALLPAGVAPAADSLAWSDVSVVVSKMPPCGPEGPFVSLMLHGWLFDEFYQSGRKAHQKFPLIALLSASNVSPVPSENRSEPQWLPTNGQFGWADQHVHKDEPVDFGDGFLFSEVFFGSDMARVAPADPTAPIVLWVAAVDTERKGGLLTCCVLLADGDSAAARCERSLASSSTVQELAEQLRLAYGSKADEALTALRTIPPLCS